MPGEDPHWDYQDPTKLAAQNYRLTCLLVGLQSALILINLEKISSIQLKTLLTFWDA
jgi:hypothetical protein